MRIAAAGCDSAVRSTIPVRPTKHCGVCGRTFEPDDWEELAPVAVLAPASVRPHLSVATDWGVDVRRCACGAVIAARSH
jgi:hypothetical protein